MRVVKKKVFIIFLLNFMLLAFVGCGLFQKEPPKPKEKELTEDAIVWVTTSGSKFHENEECSNMKKPLEIIVKEARNKGYEPCKKCFDVDD